MEQWNFFLLCACKLWSRPQFVYLDSQVSDNIEAYDTAKIYEAWYNHYFEEAKISLLLGLHDYNSEFNSLEFTSALINSSFGISRDISQVGPSIFSNTSLAARIKYEPDNSKYIQAAVYDGIPGDPENSKGTRIKLQDQDGLFSSLEAGFLAKENGHTKIAYGLWYHTAEFEDVYGELRDSNAGHYLIAERKLYNEASEDQGLGVFLQLGTTKGDRNQVDRYLGAGFSYLGLFEGRDEDVLSFGYALAHNSDKYKSTDSDYVSSEQVFELSYQVIVLPYLSIQPDFQYIRDPSSSKSIDNALVFILRTELLL